MKIALIDPPTSLEQIYGDWDLSPLETYCPPLGLLYIAGFLRKHGHTPHIIDTQARKWSLQQVSEFVAGVNPDIIGITAKTINVMNANTIVEKIKSNGIDAPVVIGGAHITALPAETFSRLESVDYGIIGEGEITLLELMVCIAEKRSPAHVKGLVWRDNGNTKINPPRPPIEDLDILPFPAWDLLPNFPEGYPHSALETRRLPAASIISSRGCPFSCTFCDRAVFGSRVRHHSAEYTLNMIRYLIEKFGVRDLMILDDNFILNKKKLFRICNTIIEEKMDLSWYCMGHAKFMTEDRLSKIRQAGCWIVEMGIESGSDRILQIIRKNTSKSEIAEAVQRARKAGLKIKGNFIFGFPTETKESLEETIKFSKDINLSFFQQNFLTIWPGCELSLQLEKYGDIESDWSRLAHQRITFIPFGLTEEDLINASKRAFRSFYIRPRIIMEIIFLLTSVRTFKSIIVAFMVFIRTIFRKSPVV